MKKIFILCSVIFTLFSTSTYAINSEWAEESVQKAQSDGILTSIQASSDLTKPITRLDIATLSVKAYINATGHEMENVKSHFTDTNNPYAETAYQLGILYGTSDTEFTPYNNTTRQEMSKIILSLKSAILGEELILPHNPQSEFTDFDNLTQWAKPYVAKAAQDGLIMGYPDGSFGGDINITWEQALSLITRCTDLKDGVEIPTLDASPKQEINLSGYVGTVEHGTTRIKWDNPSYSTNVTVKLDRNSYYEGDIAPLIQTYQVAGYIDLELYPNRKYTITVDGGMSKTFSTSEVIPDGADAIQASYPTTQSEAEPLMVTVTVPVWRLSGGEKVSSTASFKVHNAIADKIKLVFEEIYNGDEKFPIKDVGGYAWRGGRSEHNGGTAIDINYAENYCIYNNGNVIGSYWKPYEDPYSITPHGDVVNAFERHGFTWGGDAWRNPKDYMHFSYLGT